MSHVARTAHRRNPRAVSSASLNACPVAVTLICASLKHAYTGEAKSSTEVTSAVMSCNLTLQLDRPSNFALFLIFRNAILARYTLACSMWQGDLAFAAMSTPKYLNVLHCCNACLST